jgi:hypothetical protein
MPIGFEKAKPRKLSGLSREFGRSAAIFLSRRAWRLRKAAANLPQAIFPIGELAVFASLVLRTKRPALSVRAEGTSRVRRTEEHGGTNVIRRLFAFSFRPVHVLMLALAGGVSAITGSAFVRNADIDLWNCTEAERTLQQELEQGELLDNYLDNAVRRTATRTEDLEALAAGRIPLADAVQRNRELNEMTPEIMSDVRKSHPAWSDEESVALQFIQMMRSKRWENADEGAAAVKRLEMEHNAMKASSVAKAR